MKTSQMSNGDRNQISKTNIFGKYIPNYNFWNNLKVVPTTFPQGFYIMKRL
jgi:hypothetical protein